MQGGKILLPSLVALLLIGLLPTMAAQEPAPSCEAKSVQDAAGILSPNQTAAATTAACHLFVATGTQAMLAIRWGSPEGPEAEAASHFRVWQQHDQFGPLPAVLLYVDAAAAEADGVVLHADPRLAGALTPNVEAALLSELDRGQSTGLAQGESSDDALARGVLRAFGYLTGTLESRYGPTGYPEAPVNHQLQAGRVAAGVLFMGVGLTALIWVATGNRRL